jgi:hypothetical protein
MSLEEAVRTYPHMAVKALAPIIGLVEADFVSFRARAAEYRQRPQTPIIKRQSAEGRPDNTKRTKGERRTPIPERKPWTPIEVLMQSPKSSDPSTEQTRIEWGNMSALRRIQKILDRAKKGKS